MRGASIGGWFLSRRDSTIVARHEVPGIMRKIGFVPAGPELFNRSAWAFLKRHEHSTIRRLAHAGSSVSTTKISETDDFSAYRVEPG
jgi:hypothetical protein